MLIILVSFNSAGCPDDVVNDWTNYQFSSVIVIHFMNGAGVQTTVEDINTTQLKDLMKNKDMKGIFSKFRQFLYLSVFREWKKCLTCSFCWISFIKAL